MKINTCEIKIKGLSMFLVPKLWSKIQKLEFVLGRNFDKFWSLNLKNE